MNGLAHWRIALPFYLRVSLSYSAIGWAVPLAIAFTRTTWMSFTRHRFAVDLANFEFALTFGGFFFILALLTAVGDDIYRNRTAEQPTIAWNPLLMWKVFLYIGALFFLVAALLAYHQGAWLSVLFIVFATGSLIAAKRCFETSIPNN
jgi:hypothetical protein